MPDFTTSRLTDLLAQAQVETPHIPIHNFKILLAYLLDCSIPELLLIHDSLSPDQLIRYEQFTRRLSSGEPLQYVLGVAWFYGLELKVNPAVLIPRPETEGLVEIVLEHARWEASILEIGTGSGAISISLKTQNPQLCLSATDISASALDLARENAQKHGCDIFFEQCDLFPSTDVKYDLIVSNPPYISAQDYQALPAEIRDFEPAIALLADEQGLQFYRRILSEGKRYIHQDSKFCFEVGETQASQISHIASDLGFKTQIIKRDLCGKDRYMIIGCSTSA